MTFTWPLDKSKFKYNKKSIEIDLGDSKLALFISTISGDNVTSKGKKIFVKLTNAMTVDKVLDLLVQAGLIK